MPMGHAPSGYEWLFVLGMFVTWGLLGALVFPYAERKGWFREFGLLAGVVLFVGATYAWIWLWVTFRPH